MNQINITYRNLLCENGLYINEVNYKYKTQLKVLIQENIPPTKFVKSKYSNQPENICGEQAQGEALDYSSKVQTLDVIFNHIWKVAQFIRKEILN